MRPLLLLGKHCHGLRISGTCLLLVFVCQRGSFCIAYSNERTWTEQCWGIVFVACTTLDLPDLVSLKGKRGPSHNWHFNLMRSTLLLTVQVLGSNASIDSMYLFPGSFLCGSVHSTLQASTSTNFRSIFVVLDHWAHSVHLLENSKKGLFLASYLALAHVTLHSVKWLPVTVFDTPHGPRFNLLYESLGVSCGRFKFTFQTLFHHPCNCKLAANLFCWLYSFCVPQAALSCQGWRHPQQQHVPVS